MLPPNNVPVPRLMAETNIPKDTLYAWRAKARQEALGAAVSDAPTQGLSSEEKFAVVLESAAFNEVELGEYCRRKGLYPQEITAWRESCMQANRAASTRTERAEVRAYKQEIQTLERELLRKDKALAEAAALLVLEMYGPPRWCKSPLSDGENRLRQCIRPRRGRSRGIAGP